MSEASRSLPNSAAIGQFAQLLRQQEVEVDAELVADLLWLATKLDCPDWTPPPEADSVADSNLPSDTAAVEAALPAVPERTQPSPDPLLQTNLTPPSGASGRLPSTRSAAIETPAAPALRQSLALGRSLRPLMQTVPSQTEHLLDEEATATTIAERQICLPVLRPAPERWLRLALVVEESRATVIWRQTIRDFQTLLERQGAFRDVRTWRLRSDDQGSVQLLTHSYGSDRPRSPKELLDPTGRCLVLLVSDCTSVAWQRGTLHPLLQLWMRDNPVTLVQLLPERFWERSVLGEGIPVPLGARMRGEKNTRLQVLGNYPPSLSPDSASLKLPVVTLDPEPLHQWAQAIAGSGQAQVPGIVLDLPGADEFDVDASKTAPASLQQPDAERLVKRFENTASPDAKRLAGLLAAVPVTLPIIHLVQETLLPHTRQSHVAEVLMSGLLQEVTAPHAAAEPRYEFVEGVRDRLIAPPFVSVSQVDQVLETVSHYIARRAGLSVRSFTAFLMLRSSEPAAHHPDVAEFARISRHTLRRLGSDYATLIDALEQPSSNQVFSESRADVDIAIADSPDSLDPEAIASDTHTPPQNIPDVQNIQNLESSPEIDAKSDRDAALDLSHLPPLKDFSYVTPLLRVEQDIGLPLGIKTVWVATFSTEFRALESAVDRIQPIADAAIRRRLAEALAASLSLPPVDRLANEQNESAFAASLMSPKDIEASLGISPKAQYNHGIVLMQNEIAEFVRDCGHGINPDDIERLFGSFAYGQFFGRELSRMVYGDAQSTTAAVYTYAEVLARLGLPPMTLPLRLRSLLSDLKIAFPYRQAIAQPLTEQLQPVSIRIVTLERSRNLFLQPRWHGRERQGTAMQFVEPLPAGLALEMAAIPSGTMRMGSPSQERGRSDSEGPQHEVSVSGFFMGRYPVTQDQWREVALLPPEDHPLDPHPARFRGGDRPVERVSWRDAMEFCARLSRYTGRDYRLPSEAEWEYGCRAQTTSPFHFGDMITTDVANYNGSAYPGGSEGRRRGETTPVNAFNCANAFGLCDMHGNVREWCLDHWHDTYAGAPSDSRPWLSNDDTARRVLRSGSWLDFPRLCRSAYRNPLLPDSRNYCIGFRVVVGDR